MQTKHELLSLLRFYVETAIDPSYQRLCDEDGGPAISARCNFLEQRRNTKLSHFLS